MFDAPPGARTQSGGVALPPDAAVAVIGSGIAGLGTDGFGSHYAETLATWRRRFLAAWDRIAALGFDERFKRLWTYYLAYCEGGFRVGNIDVRQVVFAKR